MKPAHPRQTRHLAVIGTAAACAFLAPLPLATHPAEAQFEQADPSQDGVEAIRLAIKRGLANFAANIPDHVTLALDGPVDVEIAGSQYAAAIPALTFRSQEDGDKYDLLVGPTLSTVEPLGGNRLTAIIDPPESILGRKNEQPVFSVEWVSRVAEGTFSADLGFAETLQVVLDDISVKDIDDGGSQVLGIANAAFDVNYGRPSGKRVDGKGLLVVNDLLITPPEEPDRLTVGQIAIEADFAGFDFGRNQAYVDFTTRLGQWTGSGEPMPPAQAAAYANEIVGFLDLLDGFTQRTAISELHFSDEGSDGGLTFGSLAIGMAGLTGQEASFTVMTDIGALDVPLEPEVAPFMPRRSQVDMALEQVPIQLVRDVVRHAATGLLSGDDLPSVLLSMQDQMAAFLSSDSALNIHSAIIELEDSALFADGRIDMEPAGVFGAVGQASIRLVGLDNLAEKVRGLPNGGQIAAFLAFVQAVGQPEDGSTGVDVRRYELEVTAAGTVLLNGADVGPILEQFRHQ